MSPLAFANSLPVARFLSRPTIRSHSPIQASVPKPRVTAPSPPPPHVHPVCANAPSAWTPAHIPDLAGKTAVVTGANIGLGLEIARQLAKHNARVIMACRNVTKAEAARSALLSELGADKCIDVMSLDVSSMKSVHEFSSNFLSHESRLDILMLNAGVMALEPRRESVDGFELQFATNHLGHFLLAGLLLPLMATTPASRVVTQSSSANWAGFFNFQDLNAERSYARWEQYCLTKLSNVAHANEFNIRLRDAGLPNPRAFSVHPGVIVGQLQTNSATNSKIERFIYRNFAAFGGSYKTGAVPALFACAGEHADPDEFYGPDGPFRGVIRGNHPKAMEPNPIAKDRSQTKRLWDISEQLTSFKYDFDLASE